MSPSPIDEKTVDCFFKDYEDDTYCRVLFMYKAEATLFSTFAAPLHC